MAVKIRLKRRGRKKLAIFDVIIADSRSPRDGKFIDKIGSYNPNTNPATIDLDDEAAFSWVMKGAQPSDTVRAMLSYRGILLKKHLQLGVNKGAITQEEADKRYNEWKSQKDASIDSKKSGLAQAQDEARKTRLAAESKVSAARAEAIKARKDAEIEALKAEITANQEETELAEEAEEAIAENEAAATEAPAEEAKTEEVPAPEEEKKEGE